MADRPTPIKVELLADLQIQGYESYLPTAFDDSLTYLQKVNQVILNLNSLGKVTNDMISKWNQVIEWIVTNGLEDTVRAKMEEWLADGTFDEIIGDVLNRLIALKADKTYVDDLHLRDHRDVKQFGAKGDGVTNDTQAFRDAFGNGNVIVYVPPGTYILDEVRIPSNVKFYGAGRISKLKLTNNAPNTRNFITNMDWTNGNSNITMHDIYSDWNINRPGGMDSIDTGEVDGCNVVFVNTKFLNVQRVWSIGAGRHCFDFSASRYHHDGDSPTQYETDGCSHVYVKDCYATNSGDDLYTTHFSTFLWFTDCVAENPSGHLFEGEAWNGNGFEIDDGTRHATVTNCYAKGGARGFESKAHYHSPAPNHVKFIGCIGENNIRAFDIRHNNFHREGDPFSTTAHDVSIIGCTAINPKKNPRYASLDPRALAIASYRNVQVTDFMTIGTESDPDDFPVAIQQLSRNIMVKGITIKGYNTRYGININGGGAKTDNVSISDIVIESNVEQGIHIGEDVSNVSLSKIIMMGGNKPDSYGIASVQSDISISDVIDITGFTHMIKMGTETMSSRYTRLKAGGFVAATTTGYALTDTAAVLASTGSTKATGDMSFAAASSTGLASASRSAVIATGVSSEATAEYAFVLGSRASVADQTRSGVINGFGVKTLNANSVVGGHSGGSDTPSTQNRKWQLGSESGNLTLAGTVAQGAAFADYAEMFETRDGKAIPTGTIVALDGEYVKVAESGDTPLGVISETAGIILNSADFHWSERYEKNAFGGYILEERIITEIDETTGEKTMYPVVMPKEREDFDPTQDYASRLDREEWQTVGMVGQVFAKVDKDVQPGDYIVPNEGIGIKGDGTWQVMKVTTPYDGRKRYAVAKLLIK